MPDEAMEYTLTLSYNLWNNVISRLEVRWDHALNDSGGFGGSIPNGTGGLIQGHEDNAVLVAANIIYKF